MRSGTIGLLLGLVLAAVAQPHPAGLAAAALGLATLAATGRALPRSWRLLLLGAAIGWSWAGWDAWQRGTRQLPENLAGQELELTGRIVGLLEARQSFGRPGLRFAFEVEGCRPLAVDGDCGALRTVLLSWYDPPPLASGERWRVTARLKPPRGLHNPGGFDYQRHLYQRGIDATGYVRGEPAAQWLQEASGWTAVRAQLAETLRERMRTLPHGHWLRALSTGDQRDIGRGDWELLRATGTVHLFVVSGLHIGLVGGLLLGLIRFAGRCLPITADTALPAVLLAILAAGIYAALTGWGVPAQRAWLMFGAAALLWWSRRPLQPVTSLAMVAVLVLVVQPVAVWAPGFWLSFGAVAVILLAMLGRRPPARGLAALWRVQWTVSLGLLVPLGLLGAPLSAVSLPTNLVAVPVVATLVVPLNMLAVVLIDAWPDAAMWLWRFADTLLGWTLEWLEICAQLQGGGWLPAQTHPWSWMLAGLGALLWVLPRGWPGRIWAPLLLAPLFVLRPSTPALGEWRATVLDVGQGLAVVVETAQHRMLYDTGPRWGEYDSGERIVRPFLAYRGLHRLDLLMVSHADVDHAGGAPYIHDTLPVTRALSGEPVAGAAPASRCRTGQRWQWDGVEFEVLHPSAAATGNASSCVLLVSGGGHRLLLTGDIGVRQELEILHRLQARFGDDLEPNRPGADLEAVQRAVMVAAHHGSRSSSGSAWVAALQPSEVIFSAGWRHHFGHPHPEVVERYRLSGARLWNTAKHGAISVFTERGRLRVKASRPGSTTR